jgi:hypothetical protein
VFKQSKVEEPKKYKSKEAELWAKRSGRA